MQDRAKRANTSRARACLRQPMRSRRWRLLAGCSPLSASVSSPVRGHTIASPRRIEERRRPAVRSNARVEAINTQIRLITRRAFGFHSGNALIALAMLTLADLCPPLPR